MSLSSYEIFCAYSYIVQAHILKLSNQLQDEINSEVLKDIDLNMQKLASEDISFCEKYKDVDSFPQFSIGFRDRFIVTYMLDQKKLICHLVGICSPHKNTPMSKSKSTKEEDSEFSALEKLFSYKKSKKSHSNNSLFYRIRKSNNEYLVDYIICVHFILKINIDLIVEWGGRMEGRNYFSHNCRLFNAPHYCYFINNGNIKKTSIEIKTFLIYLCRRGDFNSKLKQWCVLENKLFAREFPHLSERDGYINCSWLMSLYRSNKNNGNNFKTMNPLNLFERNHNFPVEISDSGIGFEVCALNTHTINDVVPQLNQTSLLRKAFSFAPRVDWKYLNLENVFGDIEFNCKTFGKNDDDDIFDPLIDSKILMSIKPIQWSKYLFGRDFSKILSYKYLFKVYWPQSHMGRRAEELNAFSISHGLISIGNGYAKEKLPSSLFPPPFLMRKRMQQNFISLAGNSRMCSNAILSRRDIFRSKRTSNVSILNSELKDVPHTSTIFSRKSQFLGCGCKLNKNHLRKDDDNYLNVFIEKKSVLGCSHVFH